MDNWLETEFEAACPHCGQTQEVHLGPDGARPTPGDLSICWKCTGISQYTETLDLQELPADRAIELMANPSLQKMLALMRSAKGVRWAQDN